MPHSYSPARKRRLPGARGEGPRALARAATSTTSRCTAARARRRTSSTRARRPPTAGPARTTSWRACSRTSSRATRRCAGFYSLPQGRLGLPRPAGRDRGPAAARDREQGADRGIRHRGVQREVPRVGLRVPRGLDEADRADRLLGRPRRSVPHARHQLHRVGLVGAEASCGTRTCSTRASRSSRTARRTARRSRATRSRRATRTSRTRASTSATRSPSRRRAARGRRAARVDDDALDARLQRRRGRRPRAHLRALEQRLRARRGARRPRARRGRDRRGPLQGRGHGRRRLRAAVPVHPGVRVRREGPHRAARRTSCPPRTAPASSTPRSRSARTTSGSAPSRASNVINPVRARRHLRRAHRPVRGRFVKDADDDLIEDLREPRPAVPRRAAAARLPALLALRHAAALLRQAVLVHPHLRRSRTGCWRPTRASTGTPSTSSTGRFGPLAGEQRRLGARPRALLGHAAADLAQRGGRDRLHRLVRGARGAVRRRARGPAPPVRGRRRDPVADRRRAAAPRPRGDRRLVRLAARCRSPSGTRRSRTRTSSSEQFPADYICEGIDQTRGWFYSLIAISHAAVRPELVQDRALPRPHRRPDGKKMSKSLGNIVVPWDVIDRHGADAFRWYFLTSKLPWDGYNVQHRHGRRVAAPVPAAAVEHVRLLRPVRERQRRRAEPTHAPANDLDRWALSRLAATVETVTERLDALRRHARRPGDRGVRRRPLELVRAPLAPPLLGRRPGRVRDAAHLPGHA